jgi:hypothetical protein
MHASSRRSLVESPSSAAAYLHYGRAGGLLHALVVSAHALGTTPLPDEHAADLVGDCLLPSTSQLLAGDDLAALAEEHLLHASRPQILISEGLHRARCRCSPATPH